MKNNFVFFWPRSQNIFPHYDWVIIKHFRASRKTGDRPSQSTLQRRRSRSSPTVPDSSLKKCRLALSIHFHINFWWKTLNAYISVNKRFLHFLRKIFFLALFTFGENFPYLASNRFVRSRVARLCLAFLATKHSKICHHKKKRPSFYKEILEEILESKKKSSRTKCVTIQRTGGINKSIFSIQGLWK